METSLHRSLSRFRNFDAGISHEPKNSIIVNSVERAKSLAVSAEVMNTAARHLALQPAIEKRPTLSIPNWKIEQVER